MTLQIETPALLFSATSFDFTGLHQSFSYHCYHHSRIEKSLQGKEKQYGFVGNQKPELATDTHSIYANGGCLSLFLSVFTMLLLYLDQQEFGVYLFGLSLLSLLISLGLSFGKSIFQLVHCECI